MKQFTWHHTWIGAALLIMVLWFAPIGLLAIYFAFLSGRQASSGALIASRRSLVKSRLLLRQGTFAGLLLFMILCLYVFVKGGAAIPAIGSIY